MSASFRSLLDRASSRAALARQMGVPPDRISAWYRRDRIKVEYWGPLIRAAGTLGATITESELLEAANRPRETAPEAERIHTTI